MARHSLGDIICGKAELDASGGKVHLWLEPMSCSNTPMMKPFFFLKASWSSQRKNYRRHPRIFCSQGIKLSQQKSTFQGSTIGMWEGNEAKNDKNIFSLTATGSCKLNYFLKLGGSLKLAWYPPRMVLAFHAPPWLCTPFLPLPTSPPCVLPPFSSLFSPHPLLLLRPRGLCCSYPCIRWWWDKKCSQDKLINLAKNVKPWIKILIRTI